MALCPPPFLHGCVSLRCHALIYLFCGSPNSKVLCRHEAHDAAGVGAGGGGGGRDRDRGPVAQAAGTPRGPKLYRVGRAFINEEEAEAMIRRRKKTTKTKKQKQKP